MNKVSVGTGNVVADLNSVLDFFSVPVHVKQVLDEAVTVEDYKGQRHVIKCDPNDLVQAALWIAIEVNDKRRARELATTRRRLTAVKRP